MFVLPAHISLLIFQEFPWNNSNLISTNLRQKDHCSQSRVSSEIRWASLKGREGQHWLFPVEGQGAAEAAREVNWMTSGDPSCLGCSLPERISRRCDLRQNSETKIFVCNTCFPFLLPIRYSGPLLEYLICWYDKMILWWYWCFTSSSLHINDNIYIFNKKLLETVPELKARNRYLKSQQGGVCLWS